MLGSTIIHCKGSFQNYSLKCRTLKQVCYASGLDDKDFDVGSEFRRLLKKSTKLCSLQDLLAAAGCSRGWFDERTKWHGHQSYGNAERYLHCDQSAGLLSVQFHTE